MKIAFRLIAFVLAASVAGVLNGLPQDPRPDSLTNPADLEFHARLVSDSRVFHIGEPIQLEICYSSHSQKKYQTSRVSPNPDMGGLALHPSPVDGVVDLRDRRTDPTGGFAGSFLSGGPEFLESKPITETLDLDRWYRFQIPGHYSVTVSSPDVWRIKTLEEGGGRQNLTLESNAVEFEVLPPDPMWDAAELNNITQALESAKFPGERYVAIHRLVFLDSPQAINKLVDLYLQSSYDSDSWLINMGLRESSRTDQIILRLRAALSDPSSSLPPQLSWLLADLQTRKEFGLQGPIPADPSDRSSWDQRLKERLKNRDKYVASADAQLLASIDRRLGPLHAQAVYEAWSDAEGLNSREPQSPGSLSRLRLLMLDVESDLKPYQQVQFIMTEWPVMPHEQLLPVIRSLTSLEGPDAWSAMHSAFEHWCEDWPAECHTEILRRSSNADPLISQHIVFMMPEAEHSELDLMLQKKLADSQVIWGGATSVNLSALALRSGTRNLVPTIDATLDQYAVTRKFECEPQAYLLGYLFRFAPKDAATRLTAIMQSPEDPCGSQMLRYLNLSRYSDDLIPIAVAGLNSPNISAAGLSATFLGTRAPESAKAALWLRLETLWRDWHDRAAQLQSSSYSWGNAPSEQAAKLEQALASALARATNWKLTPAEHDRLFSGCLTEPCRNIADGKMSMGM